MGSRRLPRKSCAQRSARPRLLSDAPSSVASWQRHFCCDPQLLRHCSYMVRGAIIVDSQLLDLSRWHTAPFCRPWRLCGLRGVRVRTPRTGHTAHCSLVAIWRIGMMPPQPALRAHPASLCASTRCVSRVDVKLKNYGYIHPPYCTAMY